jgi:hypothetical protein
MRTEQQHFDAARQFQEYYDQTLRRVGTHAPAPVLGQSVNDYRRETLRQLKRTFLPEAHPLHQVQYRSLRSDAFRTESRKAARLRVNSRPRARTSRIEPFSNQPQTVNAARRSIWEITVGPI